jgi:hypothetical protein
MMPPTCIPFSYHAETASLNSRIVVGAVAVAIALFGIVFMCSHKMEHPQISRATSYTRRPPAPGDHLPAEGIIRKSHPVVVSPTLRQRLRDSMNYAQLVKDIASLATGGNAEAEFVTAEALRWCDKSLHLYFVRPNGQLRTLEEVQAERALHTVGISGEELATIYARCEGFLDNPDFANELSSWNQWLDKAASEKYPAAMGEQARLLATKITIESASQPLNGAKSDEIKSQAKEIALQAVQSGDPDAIFFMSDWVSKGNRTSEETATLISAWQILACQKGYDCGPNSDFINSVCDWDVQCADGRSYIDYFQRQLGSQYSDAMALAKTLDQLISAKDVEGIRSYL